MLNQPQNDAYLKLAHVLPLVAIKSEVQLDAAQAMIDRLTDQKKLDGEEQKYLDELCDLVAAYEDQHHRISEASDASLLRHLMEAKGKSEAELLFETGLDQADIEAVLSEQKSFSMTMIPTLAAYFHVPPAVFVADSGKK